MELKKLLFQLTTTVSYYNQESTKIREKKNSDAFIQYFERIEMICRSASMLWTRMEITILNYLYTSTYCLHTIFWMLISNACKLQTQIHTCILLYWINDANRIRKDFVDIKNELPKKKTWRWDQKKEIEK